MGTKEYLKRTNLSLESICNFCKSSSQDVQHLFAECPVVGHLWENLGKWIFNKIGLNFNIDETMKILGYLDFDMHFWPLNFFLLITRKYIFWCTSKNYVPNIYFLQKEIKRRFIEQKFLHAIKSKTSVFCKKWTIFERVLDDIET